MSNQEASYKIVVNGFEFVISQAELAEADIVSHQENQYHVLYRHRSVSGKVLKLSPDLKTQQVELDGNTFEVSIKDTLDQMIENMGYSSAANKQVKEVRAPMPGLVLEVSVAVGQQVKEGERLVILEAMKMENSIMVHAQATIQSVLVSAGQAVEKGQVLVVLE